jgi:uncharacterized Zn finger protein
MSEKIEKCPICETDSACDRQKTNFLTITCPRCGHFSLANEALRDLDNISPSAPSPRQRAIMSSAIRASGQQFETITSDKLQDLLTRKDKDPLEKLDLLLLHIYDTGTKTSVFGPVNLQFARTKNTGPHLDPIITAEGHALLSTCWVLDKAELASMLLLLQDLEHLEKSKQVAWASCKLTPKGLERVAELRRDKGEGKQGFVAMWFGDPVKSLYEDAIAPALSKAGYKPIRIDSKEHVNKIDDEIIMEIRRSRFVVADFTGQRGGVYYEAGFAKGKDIPVIWTCSEEEKEKLHFDIRQHNCLFWQRGSLQEFSANLHKRIEALLGHGPA